MTSRNVSTARQLVYPQSTIDRFWAKVDVRGEDECWEWTASKNKKGVGRFGIKDGQIGWSNRVAWEIANNQKLLKKTARHICGNYSCCNPKHIKTDDRSPIDIANDQARPVSGRDAIERFFRAIDVRSSEECWPWLGGLNQGYGSFKINGVYVGAHRFAWELDNGEELGERWACHHCDNRACCNPKHIYAGNRKTNTEDAIARRRFASLSGQMNMSSKLRDKDVLDILSGAYGEISNDKIGELLSVSGETVRLIKKRRTWTHINQ